VDGGVIDAATVCQNIEKPSCFQRFSVISVTGKVSNVRNLYGGGRRLVANDYLAARPNKERNSRSGIVAG
jgi:hypothetical protein